MIANEPQNQCARGKQYGHQQSNQGPIVLFQHTPPEQLNVLRLLVAINKLAETQRPTSGRPRTVAVPTMRDHVTTNYLSLVSY